MRNSEFIVMESMRAGAFLITGIIVMLFVVLAFRKESIGSPRLFQWGLALVSLFMILPVVALLWSTVASWSTAASWSARGGNSRGSDFSAIGTVITVLSPLFLTVGVSLILFSMAPQVQSPRRRFAPPKPESPPQPHPLD